MCRRPPEQLDHARVPQRAEHRRAAAGPASGEERTGPRRRGILVGRHLAAVGVAVGAHLPSPHLPQACPGSGIGEHARVVELGREDRGDAERQHVAVALSRQCVQLGDQGEVGLHPRLVQPLLAQRPDPVAGQPRQVGVQDEAERPGDGRGHKRLVCSTRSDRPARL